MKLYKYRKITELQFAFDIIINKRLYCAPAQDLNDPLEGLYIKRSVTSEGHAAMRGSRKSPEDWREYRICSLADNNTNFLLWVHYASAFQGLVLEVEIPDDCPELKPVHYTTAYKDWLIDSVDAYNLSDEASFTIKDSRWAYEGEHRIVTEDKQFKLRNKVSSIIIGHKMDESTQRAIAIVASYSGIDIKTTKVDVTDIRVIDYELPKNT